MLFDEWEEGTGLHDYDEYKQAEAMYSVMPNSFDKKAMYKLRKAMTKEHFAWLCDIVELNSVVAKERQNRLDKLSAIAVFMNDVLNTLKDECKMDVIAVYSAHMAEKAQKAERERILGKWEELKND